MHLRHLTIRAAVVAFALASGPSTGAAETPTWKPVPPGDEIEWATLAIRNFSEHECGEVVEATAANLFWSRGGELFTPSLATGCVAGVTRRFVLEVAARRRVRVTEGSYPLVALGEADEVFLTNSTWGLRAVAELDIHRYAAPGTFLTTLAADVENALAKSSD